MNATPVRHALLAVRVAGTASRLMLQTLFPQIMLAGGFGARDAGLVMLVHSAIAILTIIGFPRMQRHLSLPSITLAGGLLCAVGVAAVAWRPNLPMLLATFCGLGGVGWAVFSLRAPQEFVNLLSPDHWSENMRAVSRGPVVAALTVAPLSLWLLHFLDWRHVILGVALGILLVALSSYPVLRSQSRRTAAASETAGLPRLPRSLVTAAAGMFLSGYIAGTFNTHLIILAGSAGRGPTELALWSLAFASASLVAVSVWTAALDAGWLDSGLTGAVLICAAIGLATGPAPAAAPSLAGAMMWPVLGVGLYIESLRNVGAHAEGLATRLTGYFIILHMIAGSIGAYVTGWIADSFGSYAGGFFVLSGLAVSLLLFRLAAHTRRSSDDRRR